MGQQTKVPPEPKTEISATDLAKNYEKLYFSMVHANGIALNSLFEYNLEVADFVRRRLEKDLETAKLMTGCRSFSELNEEGMEFYSQAFEEYSGEAAKLANMGIGLASTAVEKIQQEAENATLN